jgi:hypothetical protein
MIISWTTLNKEVINPVLVICALILFSALLPDVVFANGQNTQFVPGEVMVKFRNGTEPNQLLSQANQLNPPDIEILAPVSRLLSEKTGIPLKVKQLLSGEWVLMAVDADKLTDQLVEQLRKRNTIIGIQLTAGESKAVGTSEVKIIDVAFQSDSPEYKAIKAKLAGTADDSFAGLIQELSKTLNLPLQGEVNQQGHLLLQADLREVTIVLDKKLRSLSELIALVQLNYVSTIMK